jgi:hypothetical protein
VRASFRPVDRLSDKDRGIERSGDSEMSSMGTSLGLIVAVTSEFGGILIPSVPICEKWRTWLDLGPSVVWEVIGKLNNSLNSGLSSLGIHNKVWSPGESILGELSISSPMTLSLGGG